MNGFPFLSEHFRWSSERSAQRIAHADVKRPTWAQWFQSKTDIVTKPNSSCSFSVMDHLAVGQFSSQQKLQFRNGAKQWMATKRLFFFGRRERSCVQTPTRKNVKRSYLLTSLWQITLSIRMCFRHKLTCNVGSNVPVPLRAWGIHTVNSWSSRYFGVTVEPIYVAVPQQLPTVA